MRKLILILFLLPSLSAIGQAKKPKLVVGIVVDQMRHEYLQRFESKYGNDGFKRMIRDGFEARNNHYNYIPTYTAPGHASIYTGTTPRYHGIIGNDWYSRVLGRSVYCVGDTSASSVGGSALSGKISPKNLIVNTITDELKLTTNFRSKVVGVSIKDRGAVLPAGHTPDGAYWYDSRTGEFMTSDFYMDALPQWLVNFNQKKLVDKYSNQTWNTLLPIAEYTESTPDDNSYENGFKGKETPTFPYDLKVLRESNGPYGLIRSTPFGNSLVLDLAKASIEGEQLGTDQITDFLSVSLSSTDYVGHNFGPNSVEVEDTYLRLDKDLGDFLTYLDKKIGVGEYMVFLTADHGVVANPQFLLDNGLPGGYIDTDEVKEIFAEAAQSLGDYILSTSNDQIFLNRDLIDSAGLELEAIQKAFAEAAMKIPAVAETFTATSMDTFDYTDPMRSNLQNGYNRKLSGDVLLFMKPGYLTNTYGLKGSSHGTGYSYDTHVPLLFFGAGIKKGATVEKTYITDIAPTLAMLLNISIPNAAVTGAPIEEIFE